MSDDSRLADALSICQIKLGMLMKEIGSLPGREHILSVVSEILAGSGFDGLPSAELIRLLEERYTVFVPDPDILDSPEGHVPWLEDRRGEIDWRFWTRYRTFLEKSIPPTAIDSLDSITENVLSRLENPLRHGTWDRRGLIMGHVQSGKTANYCGLACKAADSGYRLVIILSGIHNSLRSQTQIRLDEGFTGYMSRPLNETQATFTPAGVGLLDPYTKADSATNRDEKGDFNSRIAKQFGIHPPSPGDRPLIFVIKKTTGVLRYMNGWAASWASAEDAEKTRKFIPDVPVLIIDDEADLASIDTNRLTTDRTGAPDPEHNPTETNRQIRRLLRQFEKVAYVGYTATPFANIFIYEQATTKALGDDLFPRSFLMNIPPPSNYVGPARVFGLTEDENAGLDSVEALPLFREVDDHAASLEALETAGWMPPRPPGRTEHIPSVDGHPGVPPSLEEAIRTFLLACAVRRIRKCRPTHNSMLIHVIRYTKVQRRVAEEVEEVLGGITRRLEYGDGNRKPSLMDELHSLWERDFLPTTARCRTILGDTVIDDLPPWEQVRRLLPSLVAGIRVRIINGTAGDILDYEKHRDTGIDLIAIGGDKLSRGLTLEGLTVSYFLRASKMYDTLMQMGRWFGYRDRYLDLCRLYTTAEIREWFEHIAMASEELQQELRFMDNAGATPREFGLKVRSHPVLMVTSAVKMRSGQELRLSYSGDISETIIFSKDPEWLSRNLQVTESWLRTLGQPGKGRASGLLWTDVDSSSILDFLTGYSTHPDARRADTRLLSRYISTQVRHGELVRWTVQLCTISSKEKTGNILGSRMGLVTRAPSPLGGVYPDRYAIRRLVSPDDEVCDLSQSQYDHAFDLTMAEWNRKTVKAPGSRVPERPGGRQIRAVRDKSRGLLLIYPLHPDSRYFKTPDIPVIGMALSFPRSATARDVSYVVNNVFMEQDMNDEIV